MLTPLLAPQRITPPAWPILSLSEAKDHLQVIHMDDDGVIYGAIQAAEAYLDGWQGALRRCVRRQTWRVFLPCLTFSRLPFPDAVSAEVTYLDEAGVERDLDPEMYHIFNDARSGFFRPEATAEMPATLRREDAVRLDVVFGYAPDDMPESIRIAAKMLVAHFVTDRTGSAAIPAAAQALINAHMAAGV